MRTVAVYPFRVPQSVGAKDDFERFQSSEQHADGCVLLARYDFLLVFYSDLGSMLIRCQVISR